MKRIYLIEKRYVKYVTTNTVAVITSECVNAWNEEEDTANDKPYFYSLHEIPLNTD